MPTAIPGLSSVADQSSAPSTLTRAGSATLGKDQFLQLLVAQLANQDPTQPQDSTQFVAELAQFTSLEQQQNTVSRLDSLLLGQATANSTSATDFIGKDVAFNNGTSQFDGQTPVTATATLAGTAAKIAITVADSSGNVVRTIGLPGQGAGNIPITWDGRDNNGTLVPAGNYSLQPSAVDSQGNNVSMTLPTDGIVTGVAFQGGVPLLKVGNSFVKMSDVTSINERNTP